MTHCHMKDYLLAVIYLLKLTNRNTRTGVKYAQN